jgi:3-hydroxybutyryl-CoA dehydratase
MIIKEFNSNSLKIGQTAKLFWTVKNSEIIAFAKLSGDVNPLHINKKYAKKRY